ncbi:MAG TPA: LysR family transcriptional regulator, partial [Ramlibacter sp.]|nr:LysR family transcriptional regulator [Ramlibacter sp.]
MDSLSRRKPSPPARQLPHPGTPPSLPAAFGRLRLRHLQLLDALERLGSLRRAAMELGIAQPAAVVLVDDLEHAFGLRLVERTRTGTTLTPAAHGVVARARVAIEEVAQAREAAWLAASGRGRLRLGASPYLISALLPQLLVALRAELPGTTIDVREGTLDTLVDELAAGRLDALLGSADRALLARAVDLEADFLGVEPMSVVAGKGHPLHGKPRATLDVVLAGPWILPHASSHIRTLVDTAVFDLGRPPLEPAVECRGILNMMGMAAASGLLTVAPRTEIARPPWRRRLAVVESPL